MFKKSNLEHLDDLEDAYLGEQILDRINQGKERTYTLDEVERELGLAGWIIGYGKETANQVKSANTNWDSEIFKKTYRHAWKSPPFW